MVLSIIHFAYFCKPSCCELHSGQVMVCCMSRWMKTERYWQTVSKCILHSLVNWNNWKNADAFTGKNGDWISCERCWHRLYFRLKDPSSEANIFVLHVHPIIIWSFGFHDQIGNGKCKDTGLNFVETQKYVWKIAERIILFAFQIKSNIVSSKNDLLSEIARLRSTKCIASRPVTSLRHQGVEEFFERDQIFKQCPIVLKYLQDIFPGGRKFSIGARPVPDFKGSRIFRSIL